MTEKGPLMRPAWPFWVARR